MSTRPPRRFGDADLHTAPDPPEGMDPEEATVWREVVPGLVERQVFARLDTEAAARYCRAVALERRALAEWEAEGRPMVAVGSTGQPRPHPLVGIMRDARGDAARLGASLLLDPASRARAGDTTTPTVRSFAHDMEARIGVSPRRVRRNADTGKDEELPVFSWDGGLLYEDGEPYPAGVMPPKLTRVPGPDTVAMFEELYPDGPPPYR